MKSFIIIFLILVSLILFFVWFKNKSKTNSSVSDKEINNSDCNGAVLRLMAPPTGKEWKCINGDYQLVNKN